MINKRLFNMRILHIINSLDYGGAERLIVDLIPKLNKLGIKSEVLLLRNTKNKLRERLDNADVKVYTLRKSHYYNPINIFRIIPYINRYDIVHSHLFPTQYWVALAKIISLSSVKIVTTEHTTDNIRKQLLFFRCFEKFIYNIYSKIICISPETKDYLDPILFKADRNKTHVVYNGVNVNFFRGAKPYLLEDVLPNTILPKSAKIVLQVAAFRDSKDQDTLIKSFLYLPKNYVLLLVGDGYRKKKCEEIVHQLNLGDRVFFLGIREDVERLTKTADIIVLSSKWEGFGLVAVEAMAAGKPLIASNVPGLSGIIQGAGVLFNVGDFKGLANDVVSIIENSVLYNELVEKSLKRAYEYDISIMADEYSKIYYEIIESYEL